MTLPAMLKFNPKLVFGAFLTLAFCAVGGALFEWLTVPLAWLIGAMIFSTVAALAGAPLKSPGRLRHLMIGVLGIMLGSSFTPDVLEHVGQWWVSMATLVTFVIVLTATVALLLNKMASFDPVTSYFSAAPGGFATMVVMGAEMGGDERDISLIHAIRIMVTVLTIPLWFRFYYDYVPGVAVDGSAVAPADLDGGHRYGQRPVYEFDITLDPVAALNPAFASTTQMAVARVRIDMATGRMTIDGHDVAGADHAVAEACARLHHKSVK